MQSLQNRLDSFSRQKRVKTGTKSTALLKWPHPASFLPNPGHLAEAGFYWNPSYEDRDNVTCYMCGKELSEWTENDDPFEIHYDKCAESCSWAFLRCGLRNDLDKEGRFVSTDKTRHPTSKTMEKARLDTFAKWWIHDTDKTSSCSSKKMAQAGFIYSPQEDDNDDLVICVYCDVSLSGWDEGDDPLSEHRKRVEKSGLHCAFFESSSKALGRSTSKPSSRTASKSKPADVKMPTKTYDGSGDSSDGSQREVKTKAPRASRAATKGAKTPSRSASQRSKRTEETEDEDITVPAKPSRARKASTRTRSVSRAPSAEEPEPPARKSRAKPKPIPETEEEAEEEEDEVPDMASQPVVKHTRTRSKAKAVDPDENEAPEPAPVRTRKPSTRSKSVKPGEEPERPPSATVLGKSRSAKVTDDEDVPTVKKTTSKKKKNRVVSDEDDAVEETQPKKPAKVRASRAKPQPPDSGDDELDVIVDPPPVASSSKKVPAKSRGKAKVEPPPTEEEIEEEEEEDAPPPLPRKSSKRVKAMKEDAEPAPSKLSRAQAMSNSESEAPPTRSKKPIPPIGHGKKPSKPKKIAVVDDEDDDGDLFMDAVEELTPPPPAKPTNTKLSSSSRSGSEKPISSKPKAPLPPVRDEEDLSKTMEVEISSGDDEPPKPVPKKGKGKAPAPAPKPQASPPPKKPDPSPPAIVSRSNVGKLATKYEFPKTATASTAKKFPPPKKQASPVPPPVSPPRRSPSPPPAAPSPDVAMDDYAPSPDVDMEENATEIFVQPQPTATTPPDVHMGHDEEDQTEIIVQTQPVTPPRKPSTPLPVPVAEPSNLLPQLDVEAFLPVLSSEPFIVLDALSEAELSMTVEEWIRFQMRLECEKFERDMEREVLRFERRAQEVQRTLEAM